MNAQQTYYGWTEDSRKVSIEQRVKDAADAYERRFHTRPNIVLMSESDCVALNKADVDGIMVRVEKFIRSDNYWAGVE